jgi:acyl dehydratase
VIDYFASQDIERDGETLADWLARHLGEHAGEARTRLAAMQRARADVGGDEQPAHLRQVA